MARTLSSTKKPLRAIVFGETTKASAQAGTKSAAKALIQAERIPMAPVAKSVQMRNLARQRAYGRILEQFADEDLSTWPAYAAVHGYAVRGRAHYDAGNAELAEHDLSRAAELMVHDRSENAARLWALLARNRAQQLDDEKGARQAYDHVVTIFRDKSGGAGRLDSMLDVVRFHRERGEYDKALERLALMDPHGRRGSWGGRILSALGKTHAAAGSKQEAVAAYEELLANDSIPKRYKEAAQKALDELNSASE